jgi:hypothetical protein
MTQLNANNVTNLYLYGQLSTPTNLVDDNLIRPQDAISRISVDIKSLMETGPIAILNEKLSLWYNNMQIKIFYV